MQATDRALRDLDQTDRRILDILQRDGRIANAELAKQVNLSATPTLERVKRLERDGFIEKYAAVLNPQKMEAALVAMVQIALDRTTEDVLSKFADAVRATDEVVECQMLAGGFDYLLKVRVQDMTAYRHFLGAGLASLPGVRETHTYIVMEEVKATTVFPVGLTVSRQRPKKRTGT